MLRAVTTSGVDVVLPAIGNAWAPDDRHSRPIPTGTGTPSTPCGRASTGGSTRRARSTSTTRAAACTRESQIARARASCCARRVRQPALQQPDVAQPRPRSWSAARRACCEFFDASPTSTRRLHRERQRARCKLVGEAYPFAPGSRFSLTADNHNSVNGIREFARAARRATSTYVPLSRPTCGSTAPSRWRGARPAAGRARRSLFAFPAQSNFSGVQHPLELDRRRARRAAGTCCSTRRPSCRRTASTCRRWQPDFVAVSFYKMFGYPDRRRLPASCAARRWPRCGGRGSPAARSASPRWSCRGTRCGDGEAGFEDGTIDYLGLPGDRDRAPPRRGDRARRDPQPGAGASPGGCWPS